jgi:hypothetical protein
MVVQRTQSMSQMMASLCGEDLNCVNVTFCGIKKRRHSLWVDVLE